MVAVAALALTTDSFDRERLGTAIGYLGSATGLGFVLGPFLGGLTHSSLGYEAVFVAAAVIVEIDFILRMLLIEKKVRRLWIEQDAESPTGGLNGDNGSLPRGDSDGSSRDHTSFALLKLAQQPRILVTLWALLVNGLFYAAFDAVGYFYALLVYESMEY